MYIIGDFPLPLLIIIGYQFSFAADHYSVLFAQMGMWHVYKVNGCKTQVGIRPHKLTFLVVYSCLFQYIPLYSNCCYLSCSPTSHLELQLTTCFRTIYFCIFKPPIDAWGTSNITILLAGQKSNTQHIITLYHHPPTVNYGSQSIGKKIQMISTSPISPSLWMAGSRLGEIGTF